MKLTVQDQILISQEGNLAYISMKKPPANAYEINFLAELSRKIAGIEHNPMIKIVILESALPNFFCAGADIKIFAKNSTEGNLKLVSMARKVTQLISSSSKIFVAAIRGHALGGGLELALACDFRVAAEGTQLIGLPEIKLGLVPGNGGMARLFHLLGVSRAMELLIVGEPLSIRQAYDFGLIHHIHDADQFEAKVKDFALQLATGPRDAMAEIKKFAQKSRGLSLQEALALETESVTKLYDTASAKEGFHAFIEKRKPNFE